MKVIIFDTETTGLPGKLDTVDSYQYDLMSSKSFNGALPPVPGKISYRPKGEVVQMSALVCDLEELAPLELISFYCMPTEPISDGASGVHKISNSSIRELSKGKYLEDYLLEPRDKGGYSDVFGAKGNIYIAYNSKFDIGVINNTLAGYSMEVDFGRKVKTFMDFDESYNYNLCLMEAFRSVQGLSRNVKLSEALDILKFTKLDSTYEAVLKRFNKQSSSSFHNADYDTVAAWSLLYLLRPYL